MIAQPKKSTRKKASQNHSLKEFFHKRQTFFFKVKHSKWLQIPEPPKRIHATIEHENASCPVWKIDLHKSSAAAAADENTFSASFAAGFSTSKTTGVAGEKRHEIQSDAWLFCLSKKVFQSCDTKIDSLHTGRSFPFSNWFYAFAG